MVRQFDPSVTGGATAPDQRDVVTTASSQQYSYGEQRAPNTSFVGHSAHMTVIDTDGMVREIVSLDSDPGQIAADIRSS